jgi:hypothetical protein
MWAGLLSQIRHDILDHLDISRLLLGQLVEKLVRVADRARTVNVPPKRFNCALSRFSIRRRQACAGGTNHES